MKMVSKAAREKEEDDVSGHFIHCVRKSHLSLFVDALLLAGSRHAGSKDKLIQGYKINISVSFTRHLKWLQGCQIFTGWPNFSFNHRHTPQATCQPCPTRSITLFWIDVVMATLTAAAAEALPISST
jgi:hypothetical protein